MKNSETILAYHLQNAVLSQDTETENVDVIAAMELALKTAEKDLMYIQAKKIERLTDYIIVTNNQTPEEVLELIENHPDETDNLSWVEDVNVMNDFETSFTVRSFLNYLQQ